MGSTLCTLFRQKPVNVLYFGLHSAGKTTLHCKLKLGDVPTTLPSFSDYVEDLDINGTRMVTWEVGFRSHSRVFLRFYMDKMDAVVFIVDSEDREKLPEAVDDFLDCINPAVQERQLPVLVLANKQDKEKVMSPEEIKTAIYEKGGEAFRLSTDLEVFPTVALTLEGVNPAMEWLTTRLALIVARNSYCSSFSLAKIKQYPASFLKSTYRRVTGRVFDDGGS